MTAYYNEVDPYAAQWLKKLIAQGHIASGDVDERSIVNVRADDLKDYDQCHFFAGIGGWSYALRLGGWPDDKAVWTGSCPCQPYSSASRGRRVEAADSRHLWPIWFRLISAVRPPALFGEQVATAKSWLDEVCFDLEGIGYASGAVVLPAFSVGKDHVRERIYIASYPDREGQPIGPVHDEVEGMSRPDGEPRGVVPTNGVSARVAQLRAFGNAIVPQVAAEFIGAFIVAQGQQL